MNPESSTIKDLIKSINKKHSENGININPPARPSDVTNFEKRIGFLLPADFKEFYLTCNGFSCDEDIFNMMSLPDIGQHPKDYGDNWFYFSEYMIFSDMWGLRFTQSVVYEIFNGSYPTKPLTSSLAVFLDRFLKGNVFDKGGLYEWHEELGIK